MERKCAICKREIPKDRGKNAITCSHICSIKYLRNKEYQKLHRKKRDEESNNRCPVCNKLIGKNSKHCVKHSK